MSSLKTKLNSYMILHIKMNYLIFIKKKIQWDNNVPLLRVYWVNLIFFIINQNRHLIICHFVSDEVAVISASGW